jgi:hypothetical protein
VFSRFIHEHVHDGRVISFFCLQPFPLSPRHHVSTRQVGYSSLLLAAMTGSSDVVDILLEKGADHSLADKVRHTMPRHVIYCKPNAEAFSSLSQVHFLHFMHHPVIAF